MFANSRIAAVAFTVVTIVQISILSLTGGPRTLREHAGLEIAFKSTGETAARFVTAGDAWREVVTFLWNGATLGFHEVMEVRTAVPNGDPPRVLLTAIRVRNGLRRLIVHHGRRLPAFSCASSRTH